MVPRQSGACVKSPSILLSKETLSGSLQVPVKGLYRSRQSFIVFPTDVAAIKNLSASAKMVLMAMAIEARGTGYCAASDDALGQLVGLSRPTVIDGRKRLEKADLVRKDGPPIQQVQPYALLHSRFLSANAEEKKADAPSVVRKREWQRCGGCHRLRPALPKTGICRSCSSVKRTENISERVARKVVREEIDGKTA